MAPPKPMTFSMVTVQLDHPQDDHKKAFEEIREMLAIGGPEIDNKYGAIPNNGGKNEFVVLIEENLARKLQAENPAITGVYRDSKLDPFFTHGGCEPPPTRGGPRRNPKL
jgi:hypothetical protein